MARGWVKSLQCKSTTLDDVFNPSPKLLMPSYSCRRSSQSIKDVIETRPGRINPKPDPSLRRLRPSRPDPNTNVPTRPRRSASARNPETYLPSLTELSEGHPSRNVVEIIFHTSWSPEEFRGRFEMILKVENGSRTLTRFEEYREMVKSRAGESRKQTEGSACDENARCLADGNEMMRFYPLCVTPGICGRISSGAWDFPGGKGTAICTFAGSGEAHASTGAVGGRRAMLVCRVIAGRVTKKDGFGFDSVTGRDGALLVLDTRAVLTCFLVIYKL